MFKITKGNPPDYFENAKRNVSRPLESHAWEDWHIDLIRKASVAWAVGWVRAVHDFCHVAEPSRRTPTRFGGLGYRSRGHPA